MEDTIIASALGVHGPGIIGLGSCAGNTTGKLQAGLVCGILSAMCAATLHDTTQWVHVGCATVLDHGPTWGTRDDSIR
ncbi:hypothetical protein VTN96DRAFT_6577 [Rasamsonia emersonii]